jgi:hypothetical protein
LTRAVRGVRGEEHPYPAMRGKKGNIMFYLLGFYPIVFYLYTVVQETPDRSWIFRDKKIQ